MPFHRHHLWWLMLQSVEAVHVARKYLDRHHQCCHPHGHRKHLACVRIRPIFQQVPCTDTTYDERSGKVGSQHRMDQAIGKARAEYDIPPALAGQELPIGAHLEPDRGLHPAIDREDPECRYEGAERDHECGREVQAFPNPVHTEQHDSEKTRFEEEGRKHLVSHQWPDYRAGLV